MRTEVQHGEVTPALARAMRRASVMKRIEQDFSLNEMSWNTSHTPCSKYSESLSPQLLESRKPFAKSAISSLFQSTEDSKDKDPHAEGLKGMLMEDSTRIAEIMEENQRKSKEQSETSSAVASFGSSPNVAMDCGLSINPDDPIVKARPEQIAALDQETIPKFFVPTPGKAPIFHVSELHLTQSQQKLQKGTKDLDMSERREGELSPRTKRKMKEAADLLKKKVIQNSSSSVFSSSSKNGDFKKSIFEHLYQVLHMMSSLHRNRF